jgi:hypothetical protein
VRGFVAKVWSMSGDGSVGGNFVAKTIVVPMCSLVSTT